MKNSDDIKKKRKLKTAGLIGSGTIALLCLSPFISRLIFRSISIDTEMMINTPERMLTSWLYHERPGLVLSKYLFGQTSFHYEIEIVGTVVFLVLFCILMAAAAGKILNAAEAEQKRGRNAGIQAALMKPFVWAFPFLFLTHPALTEQLHFLLQSMEIAWAMLICLAACLLTFTALWNRRPVCLAAAVILMAWSFSSYQSLMALYIAVCAGMFLLYFDRYKGEERKAGFWWRLGVLHVLIFAVGFLLSRAAAMVGLYVSTGSVESTAYVAGMVKWGSQPVSQCLRELFHYGKQILLGQGVHYTLAYLTAAVGTILILGISLLSGKKAGRKAPPGFSAYLIAGVILYLSPFLLPLYLGGADQVRAQLALAFVIAFGWCYLILLAFRLAEELRPQRERHSSMALAAAACAVALLFGAVQGGQTLRLTYTAYNVYRQECALSEAMVEAIRQTGAPQNVPVQLVGQITPAFSDEMVRGETIGWSFYEWDSDKPYGSSERILGLWQTLGYEYQLISQDAADAGRERAASMPCWPETGSVSWDGSTVIIRLS